MVETRSEREQRDIDEDKERRNKRLGYWNPRGEVRQKQYLDWLKKQAKQRTKTLELDGASHSRDYKNVLKQERKWFEEEAKRVKDLLEDGK